jgi:predicted TIM-barrel fold metal-dependent hydrolase
MGWHVECHLPIDRRPEWTDVIESFDIPVVIDHMGRPTPGAVDPSSPPLAQLIRLVEQERCFVKLSAPYRLSPDETTRGTAHGEPRRDADGAAMVPSAAGQWTEVTPLARAFLEANASACCWGTDWPHVDTAPPVDTLAVVAALDDWRGDRWTRRQITGDLAERLFA